VVFVSFVGSNIFNCEGQSGVITIETDFRYFIRRHAMPNSVYKVIELVGTSEVSWEDAAKRAVERASKTLRDLRIAEVTQQDMKIEGGKVVAYRTKVSLSFKFEGE
jgi:flavin-binding protein dodecin